MIKNNKEQVCRKEFEEWYIRVNPHLLCNIPQNERGVYLILNAANEWRVWQSAWIAGANITSLDSNSELIKEIDEVIKEGFSTYRDKFIHQLLEKCKQALATNKEGK